MSYVINYYGGIITIPVNTANTTATPLTLIGRNWTSSNNQQGFGQALNQNFVSLLENFANSTQPNSPLKGQFWYDTTTSKMKWNDGTPASPIWSTVADANTIDQSIGNGTSNVDVPVANGNINLTVGGISNVMVVTTTGANITGALDVTTVNAGTVTATTLDAISQITSDTVIANTLQSTINDGITQPITVATTVKVDNLNADLLDGYHASNVRNTVNSVVVRNVTTGLVDNDINGNVSGSFGNISTINAGAINSSGTINFTTATQVSLGPVSNIQITGGALGQVLTTDGSGVLSWAPASVDLANGTSNVSIPTVNSNINLVVNGTNRLIVTSTGANVIGDLNVTGGISGTGANISGTVNIATNTATDAVRITQTGTGNAFVVEDSTNPDATPFIVDTNGRVGIGGAPNTSGYLTISGPLTDAVNAGAVQVTGEIQSSVTTNARLFRTNATTAAASFTLTSINHYTATQGTIGAGSTVTNQYGFTAQSSLIGATRNYGFYSAIPNATGRWNFYAAGTAPSYFEGDVTAAANLSVTGTSNLGAVGNVKITGGTAGSILSTDGAGNLAWIVISAIYPIGSIYINSDNTTNPATFFGFGTWVPFGAGRVMVGLDAADPLFDTLEETGGSKDAVVVSHTHTASTASAGDHIHTIPYGTSGTSATEVVSGDLDNNTPVGTKVTNSAGSHTHGVTVDSTGSSATNNNLQPYITVAMWKRTA